MSRLPDVFLQTPIAHRGLHGPGRPENSLAAFQAAIDGGYGIECDLQLSADGAAVVFHDYTLDRMTDQAGAVCDMSAKDLAEISLSGTQERIPPLTAMLDLVAGRAPLLIEVKDQTDGAGIGPLESALATALCGYEGPAAVMNFNPDSVAWFEHHAPDVIRGLVSHRVGGAPGPGRLADTDHLSVDFVSHDARDLPNRRAAALKAGGIPVLTWTVTSANEAAHLAPHVDNITFEAYLP